MREDNGRDLHGYRGNLSHSSRTIAEMLKPAGCRTHAMGKWHVGFDCYSSTIHGTGSFYHPSSLVRDDNMLSPYADPEVKPAPITRPRD